MSRIGRLLLVVFILIGCLMDHRAFTLAVKGPAL